MTKNNNNLEESENKITKRLDAIIRLQMEDLLIKKSSMAKLYLMLQNAGLTTNDIGKIVDKDANDISSAIIHYTSDLKKKSSKSIKKKEVKNK